MNTESKTLAAKKPSYTILQLMGYFLKLGAIGFGGPVALVGYMYRDLVEQRHWISDEDYKEGLALAQMAPGPLAAQLGIYIGYVDFGIFGATLAGLAFVLPSFLMVVALGAAYVRFGGLNWMQAVFYGVGASVIGIISFSAQKLTKKTIGKDKLLWAVYLALAVITVITETEIVWMFIAGGLVVWLIKAPPRWLQRNQMRLLLPIFFSGLVSTSSDSNGLYWKIFKFFAKAGTFVFGSGLAIVPFLYGGVVKDFHWLSERQFIDAVAVAMITPGPVVITVGFIGYLIAGLKGAIVAAFATFFPCYLFTIIPAPYFKKYGKRPGVVAFVDGITAASIGAITGAVIVLGRRTIVDLPTAVIAVAAYVLLWKSKKVSEPMLVAGAALIGLVLKMAIK